MCSISLFIAQCTNAVVDYDECRKSLMIYFDKSPRSDPHLKDDKIDAASSAELVALGFKRMVLHMRRCSLYEDKRNSLIKRLQSEEINGTLAKSICDQIVVEDAKQMSSDSDCVVVEFQISKEEKKRTLEPKISIASSADSWEPPKLNIDKKFIATTASLQRSPPRPPLHRPKTRKQATKKKPEGPTLPKGYQMFQKT